MGEDDAIIAALVAVPTILVANIIAIVGGDFLYSFYNALPWSTVAPRAVGVVQNSVNTTVTILGLDPTTFIVALFAIVMGLASFLARVILRGGGAGSSSDFA